MDYLTFISKIVEAIVWPIVSIIIVLIIRKPLLRLLPNIKILKLKDFSVEFQKGIDKTKQEAQQLTNITSTDKDILENADLKNKEQHDAQKNVLDQLASISPRSAILEAWTIIEKSAVNIANILNMEKGNPLNGYHLNEILNILVNKNIIPTTMISVVQELRVLRNKVVHGGIDVIAEQQANEYISLALVAINALENAEKSVNKELLQQRFLEVKKILQKTINREVKMYGDCHENDQVKILKDFNIDLDKSGASFKLNLLFEDNSKRVFEEIEDVQIDWGYACGRNKPIIWFKEIKMKEPHYKIVFDTE